MAHYNKIKSLENTQISNPQNYDIQTFLQQPNPPLQQDSFTCQLGQPLLKSFQRSPSVFHLHLHVTQGRNDLHLN